MRAAVAVLVIALGLSAGPRAWADEAAMSFEVDRERTARQQVLIASLAGSALVVGGVGVLFHLDARERAAEISASGDHTGLTYTAEIDGARSDALRSRALAIAAYGLGGGLLVATLVAYVVTDPGTETITLDDGRAAAPVTIVPVDGGALGTASWTF